MGKFIQHVSVSGGSSEEAGMETSAILTMSASPSQSSASGCGCKGNISSGPVNTQCKQELESLMFEGGSDVFTSNRHALHNNEAKTFNLLTYRTQDDAPFFSPRPAASPYTSATVPVEREGCEKVTRLMLRSNIQWLKHAAALTLAGVSVFGGIHYLKGRKNSAATSLSS